jgi:hypothetical protein
MLEFISMDLII